MDDSSPTFVNASQEFEELATGLRNNAAILCASLMFMGDGHPEKPIFLKKGYTREDYDRFLDKIDRNYQNNYQQFHLLYGNVWLDDGTWFERQRTDGSFGFVEVWKHNEFPPIPPECEETLAKSVAKKD